MCAGAAEVSTHFRLSGLGFKPGELWDDSLEVLVKVSSESQHLITERVSAPDQKIESDADRVPL